MKTFKSSMCLAIFLLAGSLFSTENVPIGVVNFASCMADSKLGKKEQENIENIRNQVATKIESIEKELREVNAKLEDTEFRDSLSPKAEEELNVRYQTLQEELGNYQNQYYQILQQTQYHIFQKLSGSIAKAAETIAKQKNLDFVVNKDFCYYIRSDLDVTSSVISEMDKLFDLQNKDKKLTDNERDIPNLQLDNPMENEEE